LPIAGIAKFNSRHQAQLRRSGLPSIASQEPPASIFLLFVLFPFILEAVGNQFAGQSIIVDQQKARACAVAAAA
jgi:hypothetical protein